MAAATVNSLDETIEGNKRIILANLTWTNGDTYVTGLFKVDDVCFQPTTASAPGLTESSGTVTLVSGGSLTGWLRASGT